VKVPRNVSGDRLVRVLCRRGYWVVRQTGSHATLTRREDHVEHHVTVPMHNPIKVGTLNSILGSVVGHLGVDRDDLIAEL
jgi:predicted RNA binding protein YcfA (HicA-like mRNA interferase family)